MEGRADGLDRPVSVCGMQSTGGCGESTDADQSVQRKVEEFRAACWEHGGGAGCEPEEETTVDYMAIESGVIDWLAAQGMTMRAVDAWGVMGDGRVWVRLVGVRERVIL